MSRFHQLSDGKSGSGAGKGPLRITCAHTAAAATAHSESETTKKREPGRGMSWVNLAHARPEWV